MKIYTTGQVARIIQVAPRTIAKWFDTGRLKGYRIPGSADRRIPEENLREFLTAHGMPSIEAYLSDQQPLCDAGEQR